ncbi:MAG: FAD-dependent oxidoreductase [Burkholderiales bacterium PBB4]|nr:MAG: FAD-dependent oxidoreductase [Burkholderiales bacterium PBB4]
MLLHSDTQLNQRSYYEASVIRPIVQPSLQGEFHADVVVVGAGYAGLSAALELAQRGFKVIVLEADRICSGASGRNGGQTIVGFASGQGPFEAQLGADQARVAWDMSLEAIRLVDARIAQFNIACDRVQGYLYVADSARKARKLEAEVAYLERTYGFKADFAMGSDVQRHIQSPLYCAAAYERASGHLHPLKYGLGLAKAALDLGVQIFEHSAVIGLQRGNSVEARTIQGAVRASFAVLTGNCTLSEYGPRVAPEIAARIMPVGTYIIGTAPLNADLCQQLIHRGAAVCDNNFILDYFRFSADHRLLFGGRVSYSTRTPRDLQSVMSRRLGEVFPQLNAVPIEYVWGGFVDISMNRAPDFGRLGSNVYYLQGFSGHGVALTGLGGLLVAQAIVGQAERFDVFAKLQHRNFPGGPLLRMPSLVLGTAYHRLMDAF